MPRSTHPKEKSILISVCTIKLILPGCTSLKQKRSLLAPLLSRLHKEFNVSASETGLHDVWQSAWIAAVLVSNDADHNTRLLNNLVDFIEIHFPELQVSEHHIENR